ncbi:MAG TPA: hypothetical protein VH601_05245 [Bryobacteraceae bacterium]|jgi:hypothetical protein
MAEEPELPSGSHALEYLRLFRQEGRSLAGLVLLEIGWVLLLVLASKLTGAAGESPAAGHENAGRPAIWSVPINFLEIWAIGGLAILFLWLVYSGLLSQVLRIAYTPLRPIVHFLFTLVVVLIGTLDFLVSAILSGLRRMGLPDLIKAHRLEWIQRKRKEEPNLSEEEATAAYEQWVAALKVEKGEDALEEFILQSKRSDPFALVSRVWQGAVGPYVLRPTQSSIRIGMAVPVIHSQASSQRARPAAPFPNLLRAYANAKSRTKRLPAMTDVRMMILPLVVPISTHERARVVARLLGVDMLIWCDAPLNPMGTAHLFLQKSPERIREEPEEDLDGDAYQRFLFPTDSRDLRIDPPAFALTMTDELGAYAGLIIAVALAICRRRRRSYNTWLRSWDRTFRFADALVSELLEHLAFDVLPRMTLDERNEATVPSIRRQVAELVGCWVGRQMREDAVTKDRWEHVGETRYGEELLHILEGCLRLAPDRPENWFRMGALACFLGDRNRALDAFHRAAEKVQRHLEIRPLGALALAGHMLKVELTIKSGLSEGLAWGHYAAHVACALSVGGEREIKEIREMLTSDFAAIATLSRRITAIEVVEALLDERSETAPESVPEEAPVTASELEPAG